MLYRFADAWVVWEEGWKDLKKKEKKKRLSKEDETKEECYRFANAWVVWEEEWKELKK